MTYISSQSFTAPLRSAVLNTQSQLARAQAEVSSGAPADLGLTLGAGTGNLLSLRAQVERLNGFTAGNTAAATRLSTTATALGGFLTAAQGISQAVIAAGSSGTTTATTAASATAALKSLLAGLNGTVGDQSIFGGTQTGANPVTAYFGTPTSPAKAAVDTSFATLVAAQPGGDASTITGAQMQAYLSGPFADGFSDANWTKWSGASDATLSTTVAPGQSVTTSVSANASAFRQLAQGYTILSQFTGANLGSDARTAAVTAATTLINAGLASLTQLQASVGVAQSTVDTASSQNAAQAAVLTGNVDDLDGVDTYALSSRVSTLQTQLEASYELTSRLQQLSLTNYLSAG